jgi:hypothetical protein
MPLIETTDYPAIRAAINISLDEKSLPDDVIALSIYKGIAERRISDQQPTIDVYSKAAAVLLCAALLCKAVPQILSETDAGVTTTVEPVDYDEKKAELLALSSEMLSLSLNVSAADRIAAQLPTLFTVARGSRRGE